MDDEFVTSRWSDSESSTGSIRRNSIRNTRRATGQKKNEAPLHRRIAKALGLKKGTKDKASSKPFHSPNVGLHLPQDPSARANPRHHQVPEEHRQSQELARRIKSQEQLIQQHRIFRGPVPRQPNAGEDPRFASKNANELREELDFLFLAPCEKKVLFLLRGTQRASRFRPLLEPQHELLLVNVLDYDNILEAQTLVRELPVDERQVMWSNLHGQLPARQLYILRLVLFNPEIRITTHTRGSGVESPEPVSRPDTTLFFSRIQEIANANPKKIRWNDLSEPGLNDGSAVRRENSAPQLRLRGGGEGSWRSLRTYHDHFRSSRSVRRLANDERAPTVLWWLAGGNNRRGRKIPTGTELRARRTAKQENRQSVGFWATVRGARSRKSLRPGSGAGGPSKDGYLNDIAATPATDAATESDNAPASSPDHPSDAANNGIVEADAAKAVRPVRTVRTEAGPSEAGDNDDVAKAAEEPAGSACNPEIAEEAPDETTTAANGNTEVSTKA